MNSLQQLLLQEATFAGRQTFLWIMKNYN